MELLLSPAGLSISPCSSSSSDSQSQSAQFLDANFLFRKQGRASGMVVSSVSRVPMNLCGRVGQSVVAHRHSRRNIVDEGGEQKTSIVKNRMARTDARCQGCSRVHVRGFRTEEEKSQQGLVDISVRSVFTEMKGKYGAFGGGATLEKSKLDLSQSTSKVSPQLEAGGGGGNIGNKNFNGGGNGGDDDDYFGEDGDDDGGDDGGLFGRRLAVPEIFDQKIVAAVLQEWFKRINDLPVGICQAVELGLISSGQMARFLSVNARPTVSRAVSRIVPPSVSRAFIGRLSSSYLHPLSGADETTVES